MQSLANRRKSSFTIVALLTLALLLALPIPAGAQDMTEDRVFISIRHYDGIDPADLAEGERITREGFVPLISASEGFIAYYVVYPDDGTTTAINIFETREQALASNELAREFIVENLAPLLPNPPLIVEGSLDIGFVETLDDMGDGNVSSLHAGVRIYDGFEAADLDEFVAIVEDGFLPIMRETDGFFGYYLMNNGAGAVAAVSIFDSEASALASNEKARDFVAENLTAFLPNNPSVSSGRVGIAVLADLNDGANLIDDQPVFASIRIYDGVNPQDMDTIAQLTAAGFLPILRDSDGFIAYFLLSEGDTLAAINAFETAEQAAASNDAARDFVVENLAPLLPNPPTVVQGPMDTRNFAPHDDLMMVDEVKSLYASLRVYVEVDLTQRAQTTALVNSIFIPLQQETEGFWGYIRMHDGESRSAALSIYDSEANALAANELAAEFVAEYLTDRPDQVPLRVSGRLGIAALADRNDGANLIADTEMDQPVFASVRLYDGIDPAAQAEIARLTIEGFLPVFRESDGFVGYFFLPAGDELATVSLFDSAEQASASNDKARDFIVENLAPLLPNAPRIFEGSLAMNYVPALLDSDDNDEAGELYASIRFYEGFDLAHFDEANDLAIAHLLPALQELGGLFAQFALNDGVDTIVGISVFESEEAVLAANDLGKAFTIEYVADWAPNPPTGISGKLAIASLAKINMGENLASAMMEG